MSGWWGASEVSVSKTKTSRWGVRWRAGTSGKDRLICGPLACLRVAKARTASGRMSNVSVFIGSFLEVEGGVVPPGGFALVVEGDLVGKPVGPAGEHFRKQPERRK